MNIAKKVGLGPTS